MTTRTQATIFTILRVALHISRAMILNFMRSNSVSVAVIPNKTIDDTVQVHVDMQRIRILLYCVKTRG